VTPALNALGFPIPFAIGTELANITGQSALATVKHRRMGNLSLRLGLIVGFFMLVGVEGGAQVVMWLESLELADVVIRWAYVAFLAALSLFMLHDYRREMRNRSLDGGESGPNSRARREQGRGLVARFRVMRMPPAMTLRSCGIRVSLWVPAVLGVLVGFLAGLMGTGGGFALLPAFVYVIGTPTVVAVGTSLMCVMISGAYGAFSYAMKGRVEVIAAIWMLAGAAVGAQLGGLAVRRVKGYGIRLLYALMLLLACTGVLMMQLGHVIMARVAILGGATAMCLVVIARMAFGVRAERGSA
ncbi:MAG: sulfite exporter TauE/SafE family protein, partial [Planctomycetota bacterium]|jgi:uncharacterized membrane protein YfcA